MTAPIVRWRLALLVFVWLVESGLWGLAAEDTAAPEPASGGRPAIFLHTEFSPYKGVKRGEFFHITGRELARQAMIVAATEELGVDVYDETLGETSPEKREVQHFILIERPNQKGKWKLTLHRYPDADTWRDSEPVWQKTYDYKVIWWDFFGQMVPKFEEDSRGEFIEAWTKAGVEAIPRPETTNDEDPTEAEKQIEDLLLKVDFVAQFGAVRTAHGLIEKYGETPKRLAFLTRGYANLAMLTQHHWNASCEAFRARAFLYAQRLAVKTDENPTALWNRAYMWSLTGLLHYAENDLKRAVEVSGEEKPLWAPLLEPYIKCDRETLLAMADQKKECSHWALQLWYQQVSAYRFSNWMYKAGEKISEETPTAYGAYADLATRGGSLSAQRMGAYYAPWYFGQNLPTSLDELPDLPKGIRTVIPTDVVKQGIKSLVVKDPNPNDYFSALPSYVAKELREESATINTPGCSWSALAYLLEEELFIEMAYYLSVGLNATESSMANDVAGMLPLIKDHRYAGFIRSFRYNPRRNFKEFSAEFKGIDVRDVRGNMSRMTYRMNGVNDGDRKNLGSSAWRSVTYGCTVHGILERCYLYGPDWNFGGSHSWAKSMADEFSHVAPHWEIGTRMTIQCAKDATAKQLAKWEGKIEHDAKAFALLAGHYAKLEKNDQAIRCYEQSLETLPTIETTLGLADLYQKNNKFEKWEKTLLRHLETENFGLQHAQVHNRLAYGYIARGEWERAKPHAEKAGETWSSWGLSVASHACEGLAQWEASEQYVQTMSQSYSSSSGDRWYLWCCRTGRGNQEAASVIAQKFFASEPQNKTATYLERQGTYHLLRGNLKQARESWREVLKQGPSFSAWFMVAQLSRDLEDDESYNHTLKQMSDYIEKQEEEERKNLVFDPVIYEAAVAIARMMIDGQATDEQLADAERKLADVQWPDARTTYCYYLANELLMLDRPEEADKYWRRAMIDPYRNIYFATLAGQELSLQYGASRQENDVLGPDDLWPPLEQNDQATPAEAEN